MKITPILPYSNVKQKNQNISFGYAPEVVGPIVKGLEREAKMLAAMQAFAKQAKEAFSPEQIKVQAEIIGNPKSTRQEINAALLELTPERSQENKALKDMVYSMFGSLNSQDELKLAFQELSNQLKALLPA